MVRLRCSWSRAVAFAVDAAMLHATNSSSRVGVKRDAEALESQTPGLAPRADQLRSRHGHPRPLTRVLPSDTQAFKGVAAACARERFYRRTRHRARGIETATLHSCDDETAVFVFRHQVPASDWQVARPRRPRRPDHNMHIIV